MMKIQKIHLLFSFGVVYVSTLSASLAQTVQPGEIIKDCDECPELVIIPKGNTSYSYEDNDKNVEVIIEIPRPIAVGRYEITRKEFEAFVKQARPRLLKRCYAPFVNGWKFRDGRYFLEPGFKQNDNHPAVCVSWNEADEYIQWLSEKTGYHYRLLTVDEYLYIALGGDMSKSLSKAEGKNTQFCANGNFLDKSYAELYKLSRDYVNCSDGFVYTSPVGSFEPNEFGLYDLLGNVWEWTSDCRNRERNQTIEKKRKCPAHFAMGGSFLYEPKSVSRVPRALNQFGYHFSVLGFRVVKELTELEGMVQ
jgi:formylglycine-generating enzyme required for sulfatase activity